MLNPYPNSARKFRIRSIRATNTGILALLVLILAIQEVDALANQGK